MREFQWVTIRPVPRKKASGKYHAVRYHGWSRPYIGGDSCESACHMIMGVVVDVHDDDPPIDDKCFYCHRELLQRK